MPMVNRHFSDTEIALLLSASQWRLVSSKITELPPISPMVEYAAWVAQNSHRHPYRELFFVLSGEALYSLNGTTYRCPPGTLFLMDVNETHDFYYPPFVGDFKHLWLGILKNSIFMRSVFIHAEGKSQSLGDNLPVVCRGSTARSFIQKWDGLRGGAEVDDAFLLLEMKYAWGNLITELCRDGFFPNSPSASRREQEAQKVMETIVEHIQETAGKYLDWEKLAHLAGYSKFHFARLFKEHTGFTVHDFINHCRQEKIKELTGRGFNQKQIGEELGFSCPTAFSRWRRINGLK